MTGVVERLLETITSFHVKNKAAERKAAAAAMNTVIQARILPDRFVTAADLGADEWETFKRVTLPLLMPGIIGGALMAFTLSLDDYLITVFTKGIREQTMPLYIYSLVRRGVTPEINALSVLLLVLSMACVGLSLHLQRREV